MAIVQRLQPRHSSTLARSTTTEAAANGAAAARAERQLCIITIGRHSATRCGNYDAAAARWSHWRKGLLALSNTRSDRLVEPFLVHIAATGSKFKEDTIKVEEGSTLGSCNSQQGGLEVGQ